MDQRHPIISSSQIDVLPVELLHYIFGYLWAHEIVDAFSNLNGYLDAVVFNYDRYSVNFRSILKSQFDIICRHIRPDQIISLRLSDDEETPNQSELFFSIFDIEQFIHLRSFNMKSIGNNAFKRLSNLHKLKYLSSLKLPRLSKPYGIPLDSTIQNLLPQLSQLLVYDTNYLLINQLPRLRHLTLVHCRCSHLPNIFHQVSKLHSLSITIAPYESTNWSDLVPPLTYLSRLVLRIYSGNTEMAQIEQLLYKLPRLKYLGLEIQGDNDLVDGQRWESLMSHLITFNFRFQLINYSSSVFNTDILDAFRSPFWLEQKHWLVAFDDQRSTIFTVPHFAPSNIIYSQSYKPILCTSSELCLDQYVHCLTLQLLNPSVCRFTNVTSLVLETEENAIKSSSPSFSDLVQYLPRLHSLSFWKLSPLTYLANDAAIEKIRSLNLRGTFQPPLKIKGLCTLFPRLERLNIMITCRQDLFLLIDRLKYLSIAKFEFEQSSSIFGSSIKSSQVTREWFINHSQRLKLNTSFTYKIFEDNIQLWMNNEQVIDDQRVSRSGSVWNSSRPCCIQ